MLMEEYNLWREQIRFLQEIKTGDTFNKNQIKLTEGIFEFLDFLIFGFLRNALVETVRPRERERLRLVDTIQNARIGNKLHIQIFVEKKNQ